MVSRHHYNPYSSTNELNSASWAKKFLFRNDCNDDISDRIYHLITATIHTEKPKTTEEKLIVDIDLGILGLDRIYSCDYFFHRFEYQARKNLNHAIDRL